jgi:hypothetical protein
MEQVIFLHADEDSEEALIQIQHSLAQRLVLVAPAHMDQLRLSLLLRLARRYTIAHARQLYLISEDRLAQMLAARMGFAVAATLDEYHGLKPDIRLTLKKRFRRPASSPAPSLQRPPIEVPTAPPSSGAGPFRPITSSPTGKAQRQSGRADGRWTSAQSCCYP